jgi:hypothetical protein
MIRAVDFPVVGDYDICVAAELGSDQPLLLVDEMPITSDL